MDQDGNAGRADPVRIDAGPEELLGAGQANRSWPRRWLWLVPVAVAGIVLAFVTHRGKPAQAPASPTAATASPAGPAGPVARAKSSPATIRFALSELLGDTAGWEVFGRGQDSVVRLQIGADRIVRTPAPGLGSGGGVSFVVGTHEAIVRPFDNVPGYVVPDGRPAGDLPDGLGTGGFAIPGPDPDHVWLPNGEGSHASMSLVGLEGRRTDTSIPIPAGFSPYPVADGAGYLLFAKTDGRAVYDARPGSLRRVTTGTVLAVGPTRWLVRECVSTHQCTTATVEQASGTRHELRDIFGYDDATTGLISPDGATVAMTDPVTGVVHLFTLADGVDTPLDVAVDTRIADATMVWSPDSRWLFAADRYGDLAAVERRTAQVRHFGTVLPELKQLAIRPAPR